MARVIDAPLRLHETVVAREWADDNGHMTGSAYLRATPFPAAVAGRLAAIRAAHAALPVPDDAGRSIRLVTG